MSDTNQVLLPLKMARGLKFPIQKEEGLYYLHVCSTNKGIDQLHDYPTADLLLFLRKKSRFSNDTAHVCQTNADMFSIPPGI